MEDDDRMRKALSQQMSNTDDPCCWSAFGNQIRYFPNGTQPSFRQKRVFRFEGLTECQSARLSVCWFGNFIVKDNGQIYVCSRSVSLWTPRLRFIGNVELELSPGYRVQPTTNSENKNNNCQKIISTTCGNGGSKTWQYTGAFTWNIEKAGHNHYQHYYCFVTA